MPLAWLGLGFCLGLFWGASTDLSSVGLLLLMAAVLGTFLLARRAALPLGGIALLAAGLLLGALRVGPDVLENATTLGSFHGQHVTLAGGVDGVAEAVGSLVRFRMHVSSVDGQRSAGTVVVWSRRGVVPVEQREHPFLEHGDDVVIIGDIDAPQLIGAFDYPEHLAARGIGSVVSNAEVTNVIPATGFDAMRWVHAVRRDLANANERHLPEPQAALANALVLGLRGGLAPGLNEDFRTAGLSHLLAVSGLHVGILLAMALGVSAWAIGRQHLTYLLPPLALLWLYVLMVGAPPSAVRAGLMGSAFLLAIATGRASVPINALGLAAFVVLATHPSTMWDRSFQLSFSAMAGVLLVGLPLASTAIRVTGAYAPYLRELGRLVLAPAAVSAGAVAGSFPLVAFNFGQVPLLSIPATLVAIPFVPLLMVTSGITALTGVLAEPLGTAVGLLPALLGRIVVTIAQVFSQIPGATFATEVGASFVWAAYAVIALAVAIGLRDRWWPTAKLAGNSIWTGPTTRSATALLVGGLGIVAAVPWAMIEFDNGSELLELHFLDVGQGDATLVVTPGGATVLIDGGPDPRVSIQAIDAAMPAGRTTVDLAVLTHPDADHANGVLELVRRGRIGHVIVPPVIDAADDSWQEELVRSGISVSTAVAGMRIELGDGTVLSVLHPPEPPLLGTEADVNNNSVALMLRWRETSALFTGDLHAAGELAIVRSGADIDADLLQVGHHGSRTSSATAFLDRVTPIAAVISASEDNRFGHPSTEVVDRLGSRVGGHLYTTAEDGTVTLVSDGEGWFSR